MLAGLFFAFATLMCTLAGLSLLMPRGVLAPIWRFKPHGHQLLLAMGPWVGVGFLLLAVVMLAASVGCLRRKRWGWHLAVAIVAVNGIGDAARMPAGAIVEGLVGVAAAGAILWWLSRPQVRKSFDR